MNTHARFIKLGIDTNPIVATRLLNAYATSYMPDSLCYAQRLFDQVYFKDTVLWSSIISVYTRLGNSHKALQLFAQMKLQTHPIQPNHFIYATAARACGSAPSYYLHLGKCIHASVKKAGFIPNIVVETALLDMYAKCGIIDCASKLFDEMSVRNVISWNAMIAGYLHGGMEAHGLQLFYRMKCLEFHKPDEFAVATVLAACVGINDFTFGAQVHAYLVRTGYESDCKDAICNMYFRCGQVSCAERVLKGREENATSRLVMIRGYVLNERYHDAMYYVSCHDNFIEIAAVDCTVVVPILTACASLSLLRVGRQIHGLIITLLNFPQNSPSEEGIAIVGSALINMYCKCYSVKEAQQVFDSLLPDRHVSHWNSMIAGYILNGMLENARRCFEEMPERDVISWTTIISGYVQYGCPHEALWLLAKMYTNKDGLVVQGNCFTFTTSLEACSLLSVLELGKQIHAKLIRTVVNADVNNVVVGTSLVDMYSKSGSLSYAQRVFNRMMERNVVSWTSMLTGYAIHGFGFQALEIFHQMMEMGVEPTEVTFVSVLTACSHCGLVEEGLNYFKMMKEKYRLLPGSDHYTCVIDLLGRAGRLDEAWGLLEEIESEEVIDGSSIETIWGALLGACRLHGNVEMGSRVADKILKKQQASETYITLSNVYAAAGMWHEVYRVRERWKRESSVPGFPGHSQIHVHFQVDDL
ncbi:PREDICTED: pentatricopeptide repeat-containing protein At4g15720-like [Nelumbo nucifera]|uniref:Pentatricopeptide repeat-containing protein At4g15720-like n=2 Tax=Nelumbo nucifera TaxID=4432 RepID=A0A1U7YMM5_NELNU|nr:PREDICTED: pentatricopeptide repeat-containing protein At4g15720-like [Nelumbo nucifera]DAD23904.1 TPA_asm: hypothetical protein HUJ06_025367 [Nelumbo nucifera]